VIGDSNGAWETDRLRDLALNAADVDSSGFSVYGAQRRLRSVSNAQQHVIRCGFSATGEDATLAIDGFRKT
jgi:hypothetical protein